MPIWDFTPPFICRLVQGARERWPHPTLPLVICGKWRTWSWGNETGKIGTAPMAEPLRRVGLCIAWTAQESLPCWWDIGEWPMNAETWEQEELTHPLSTLWWHSWAKIALPPLVPCHLRQMKDLALQPGMWEPNLPSSGTAHLRVGLAPHLGSTLELNLLARDNKGKICHLPTRYHLQKAGDLTSSLKMGRTGPDPLHGQ